LAAAGTEKVLAYQLLGSIPILLVTAVAAGELRWPEASALAWASLAYQCLVVAFASYLTWFWLIGRYPAGRLARSAF
ncbi:MAG TPA: EamA/RhaT family transporter, partial [Acetobacteraceae bacterium]|nr:EamA/RhaT family transporter [Acetobacteraceae bacterium]